MKAETYNNWDNSKRGCKKRFLRCLNKLQTISCVKTCKSRLSFDKYRNLKKIIRIMGRKKAENDKESSGKARL